jgi:hypothetical protein
VGHILLYVHLYMLDPRPQNHAGRGFALLYERGYGENADAFKCKAERLSLGGKPCLDSTGLVFPL